MLKLKPKLGMISTDLTSLSASLFHRQNSSKLLNISNNKYFITSQILSKCAKFGTVSDLLLILQHEHCPVDESCVPHSLTYLFFSCRCLSAEQSVTLDWTICIGRGFPGDKNWGRWGRYSVQVFYWPWNLHCVQKKLIKMRKFDFLEPNYIF